VQKGHKKRIIVDKAVDVYTGGNRSEFSQAKAVPSVRPQKCVMVPSDRFCLSLSKVIPRNCLTRLESLALQHHYVNSAAVTKSLNNLSVDVQQNISDVSAIDMLKIFTLCQ
jgi:hypothetical protein